jgi:tetratricopeptide (TPR) repeat protein
LRYAQALLYQEQGRNRRSANALESLVRDKPDDPGLMNALGYLLTDQMSRHEEALEYLEQALALAPNNPAIIDSMGWVLFNLGDYEAALTHLERAYELFPDPEVAAHIVDTQWALGNQEIALELLQQKLQETPDSRHLQELDQRLAP